MRTLYLHIGTHRTATTSIQGFLHANRAGLLRQGVLYPYGVRRHFAQINALFDGTQDARTLAADLEGRAARQRLPVHTLILSDEDICTRRDLSPLAGLAQRFRLRVIFALRRQDLWLESWYLQNVKWQWNPELSHCSLAGFLARREQFFWADYNACVTHLEQVFGRENLRLMVFERAQMPQGPVAAFCTLAGIDPARLTPAVHDNASVSPLVAELMRRLPLDAAAPPQRRLLERAFIRVDAELAKTPQEAARLLLDPAQRQEIMAEHAAGNRALAKRHFGRAELFREPLPPPQAPLARMKLPDDSGELLDRLIAPFLRALVAELPANPPH